MNKDEVLKYLDTFSVLDTPLTGNELFELLINPSGPIDKEIFKVDLAIMVREKILAETDGYYYPSEKDISSGIKLRLSALEGSRKIGKSIKSKSKYFIKVPELKYMGLIGSLSFSLDNNFQKEHSLFLIFERSKMQGGLKKLEILMKLMRIKEKFTFLIKLEDPFLTLEEKNRKNALTLLFLEHLINKNGTYEKLIHKNLWIFDHIPNYPLNKVSMSYRVSVQSVKNKV